MFKPKKKAEKKTSEDTKDVEEVIEDEFDEEETEKNAETELVKPRLKSSKINPAAYKIGDIIPVHQIAGYQVVKAFDKEGTPLVTTVEKETEAEILSFIYRQ